LKNTLFTCVFVNFIVIFSSPLPLPSSFFEGPPEKLEGTFIYPVQAGGNVCISYELKCGFPGPRGLFLMQDDRFSLVLGFF
jgi:hypothetical protein